MTLNAGTHLGPYEIISPLGVGGMGEVYRARDSRLDRLVAVKVLPEAPSSQALERFEREAKAIAALNHPGICSIYDIGTSPIPFLVMELLDGETLHERLTRGPIAVRTVIDIGLALADALSAAHIKGLIHRDLKPANIFLTPHAPKILDFGLARTTEPVASAGPAQTVHPTRAPQGPITDAGVTVGTVAYMSPEQLLGEPLDARTDLFSLGLVLYEMATGQRAFSGATSAAVSAAILHDQPTAPRQLRPEIPPRLEQALLTLLDKDRDLRTQTAAELRAELTRIKRDLSGLSRTAAAGGSASDAAAGPGSSSATAAMAAPPASSSDVQIAAGLVNRHRVALIGALTVLALIAGGAGYLASRPAPADMADADTARPSIADLMVDQLTTSGTAATPAISPDGKYVAYVELGASGDSLRMRQVASTINVPILPAAPGVRLSAPAFTPDGAFVNYLRRVAPQPAELWQVEVLGGPPKRLVTEIGSGVGFSPDGRQMAYVRGNLGGVTEVVVAAIDGTGAHVLATRRLPKSNFWAAGAGGVFGWFAPAWSPDGTTLAVFGARDRSVGEVVFIDIRTASERVFDVVRSPIPGSSLAWLDNATVILSMVERSSALLQLWLLSYPQGEFSRLTNDVSQYVGLTLSGDRNQLVTARSEASVSIWTSDATAAQWTPTVPTTPVKGPIGFGVRWLGDDLVYPSSASGAWVLERWRASTRAREIVAPGAGLPQVGGDGSWIAFLNYDTSELWKVDEDGRNKTLVGRGTNERLTPDGRHTVMVREADGEAPALYMRPIGGGETLKITAERIRPRPPLVSPNGKLIAYSAFDDRMLPVIVVCDLPACTSKQMLPNMNVLAWTPDSQGVAYVDPGTRSDIWIHPLGGGGRPHQLTHFPADGQEIWDFAWSADGRRLAVGRASMTNNIVLFRGLRRAR